MIPKEIDEFVMLIRHGSNVNSYKICWAKAIVALCQEDPGAKSISLDSISKKMFQYYWNQTIYFDLLQGNNPNKRAVFLSEVRKYIDLYYTKVGNRKPEHYEKVEHHLDVNWKKLVGVLKLDVSWRFLKYKGSISDLYRYEKGANELYIDCAKEISDFSSVLYDVINYKWTQVLENFNSSPRIAKKVRVIDFPEIKRGALGKFRAYLDIENPRHVCFHCNKEIINETPAIDHVIPWSFIYSDDLWNLVYMHQSCNSSKSNSIPQEEDVLKLEKRNTALLNLLPENKVRTELSTAIEKDFVRKFWINCK